MKVNRFNVLSYVISDECEREAEGEFEHRKLELSRKHATEVRSTVRKVYLPLVKISVEQLPRLRERLSSKASNTFFVGLHDGSIYYLHAENFTEKLAANAKKAKRPVVDRFNLLALAVLSPAAINTLGYIMSIKKTKYTDLDSITQNAVQELSGQGYARVYLPGEDESFVKNIASGLVDSIFGVQRSAYYVKSTLRLPVFHSNLYNLSSTLVESSVFDGGYSILKINHTPDKLAYLLTTMFNSRYVLREVVYLPVVECTYNYYGKDETEFKPVSAIKGVHTQKAYTNPYTPAPMMLGTVGYGLNSTPIESAAINFSAIAGMEEVKEELRKAIIYPLTRPELSKEFRQKAGGGILFYGPPGCGKTYIMQATVGEAGVNLYTAEIQDILGESPEAAAKRLHEIFREARFNTPSILFFDEIDALGGRRGQQSPEMRFVVNQFLADMSGLENSNENVLVVGATNAPWDVDPALRRAGRFTTKVFIPPPDFNTRVSLFRMYAQKMPLAGDINYERLAELTENFSSSDIAGICDKAAQIPWSDSMKGMQKRAVAMGDFTTVLSNWASSLVPWYGLAERELSASGETDVYPELKMLLERFRNSRQ